VFELDDDNLNDSRDMTLVTSDIVVNWRDAIIAQVLIMSFLARLREPIQARVIRQ
jgi:hypothetical protein